MKKVVKAVVIGVGVAAAILAVLKIVKTVGKKNVNVPKFWNDYSEDNALGI